LKVTGSKIICTDRDIISGLMAENMKDNTTTTKRRVMEYTLTLMEGATKECGRMVSRMEKASSLALKECLGKENGREANVFTGWMRIKTETDLNRQRQHGKPGPISIVITNDN